MANFDTCFNYALDCLDAGEILHMQSKPGVGKSSLARLVAEERNLFYIPCCVNAREPIDINGYPHITENGRAEYIPFSDFPLVGDPIPKGYKGWLIDFEEIDQADPSMQKALHRPLLEREIGKHKLHEKVFMIASGNRPEDRAHASPMSTALQSRMAHITLDSSVNWWTAHATLMGWNPMIIAYVNFRVDNLNNFNPEIIGNYACERNWERLHKLMKVWESRNEVIDMKKSEEIAGIVGDSAAVDFIAYMGVKDQLISVQDVLLNPKGVSLPYDAGALYAITMSLATGLEEAQVRPVFSFFERLGFEYQLLAFRTLLTRFPNLLTSPELSNWIRQYGDRLYNMG